MILCDTEIRAAIQHAQLVIRPMPPEEHFTTTAVDLRLDKTFSRWKKDEGVILDLARAQYPRIAQMFLEPVPADEEGAITLRSGDFVLAQTVEYIELPLASKLAARVEGRSSLARQGIGVHVTAPVIHADFRGQITLEITNQGPLTVKIRPGMRICQLVFEMVSGTPSVHLEGMFQDQTSVRGRSQP